MVGKDADEDTAAHGAGLSPFVKIQFQEDFIRFDSQGRNTVPEAGQAAQCSFSLIGIVRERPPVNMAARLWL